MTNQPFRTPILIEKSTLSINHNHSIMAFGSCFSTNIGERLNRSGFSIQINPFGVLYNPVSIANAIGRIVDNKPYTKEELVKYHNLWLSFDHHGIYSKSSQEETLVAINSEIALAHQRLQQNPLLIITLGSAHIYRHKESGRIVGNCHKLPSRDFFKEMLTIETVVDVLSDCVKKLSVQNPSIQIIFTISPVRYLSDGFFENQLSKSILHLSVSSLMETFPQVCYFPAYEIMMDDLRDYRFYADDMLHPSQLAVDYIWEQFENSYFSKETKQVVVEVQELYKALAHRPFQKESASYRLFVNNQIKKIIQLQTKIPHLDLVELAHQFQMRLKDIE